MKLEAHKRTPGGSSALRREGRLPAVVYNSGLNLSVSIDMKAFDKTFRQQGTSNLIDLEVDGDTHAVLVREVQMDKRKRVPQHVDFFAITKGQKLDVAVRLVFEGTSAGQKEDGQLDIQRREINISVLPRDIPENLVIDLTPLEIGDAVHIGDVAHRLPQTAELLDEPELTLVTILPPRQEVEEEEIATDEVEPEVIGEGDEEGEGASDDDATKDDES
ncbi:MAG: 50S ribosomal protein L25 [Trueperaceae bacterium]